MKVNERIRGFTVCRSAPLSELSAVMYELEHEKTGLKLAWLQRDDDNKTFGIAFETLPENDTGVFHILEHSVLCGSDKYPVKEPFVELMKSSMNTFLNAMTFPDKTFYPISSRNGKDFLNLMRVYLDAVFHPLIYSRPEIFYQEGWRYHFDDNGMSAYQGVVFNEMKGVFADADELMNDALNRALFPDTPYRFVSGGDPAKIPDLSYDEFLDAHRKYYSPSNAYVFLDGDIDVETVLNILDDEYLSGFDRNKRIAPPPMQTPVQAETQTVEYEIAPEEDEAGHTRVAWGSVIGRFDERERITAVQALAEAIGGNNQSPLCRAILSEGLAEDVILSVQGSIAQPWLKLELRNIDASKREYAERLLFDTLETLAGGLDRKQLEATLSNVEFRMRERDYGMYPQGLIFGFNVLDSWLYGGLPEANLEVGELFDGLRRKLEAGYFEKLLRELLLESSHSAKVILKPSHTAGERRNALEAKRMSSETAAWSDEEKKRLMERQEALLAWQRAEDTPEALASLPRLTLADISHKPEQIPTEVMQLGETVLLHHPVSTGGIVYVSLYFDADGLTEEELSCLSLLCSLPGNLRTSRHTSDEVTNLKRLLLGWLDIHTETYPEDGQPENYTTKLRVSFNTLERNVDSAAALVIELLTETELDSEASILDILRQRKAMLYQQLIMSGASAALGRLQAQLSASGVAEDCIGGFVCYEWLKKQEDDFQFPALHRKLVQLRRRIIRRNGLTVSVTGQMNDTIRQTVTMLPDSLLRNTEKSPSVVLEPYGVRKEGIVIPADISFAARGGDMLKHCGKYTGVMPLLAKVVSLGYLWNVIRVQGGAYGTGLAVQPTGLAACYSYRDPNGARSLESYLGCSDFIRDMCAQRPDLTGFIIGTVSDASPLLTPRAKGQTADGFYWRGLSWEARCKRREELLSATPAELELLADALERTLTDGGICVIGSREQIEACGEMDFVASL